MTSKTALKHNELHALTDADLQAIKEHNVAQGYYKSIDELNWLTLDWFKEHLKIAKEKSPNYAGVDELGNAVKIMTTDWGNHLVETYPNGNRLWQWEEGAPGSGNLACRRDDKWYVYPGSGGSAIRGNNNCAGGFPWWELRW